MIFHNLFSRHQVDFKASHWDRGRFVSHCAIRKGEWVKLPGLPWQMSQRRG